MAALLSCFLSLDAPLESFTEVAAFSFSASMSFVEVRDRDATRLVVPALIPDAEAEEEFGERVVDTMADDAVIGAGLSVPLAGPPAAARALPIAPEDKGLLLAVAVNVLTRAEALAPAGLATALESTALTESIALGRVVANFSPPTLIALDRGLGGDGEEIPVPSFF
jgi:hypothetical protein